MKLIAALLSVIVLLSLGDRVMSKTRGISSNDFNARSVFVLIGRVSSVNSVGTVAEVEVLEVLRGELKPGRYQLSLDPKPWKYGEMSVSPSELLVIFSSQIHQNQIQLTHPRAVAKFTEDFLAKPSE